jgi:hypothetical protein
VVHGTGEHPRELCGAHSCFEGAERGLGLGDDRLVVLGGSQLEQDAGVVEVARELLDALDLLLEGRALARDGLRLVRVVPEAGRQRLLLEPVDFRFELRKVKDAPLAP